MHKRWGTGKGWGDQEEVIWEKPWVHPSANWSPDVGLGVEGDRWHGEPGASPSPGGSGCPDLSYPSSPLTQDLPMNQCFGCWCRRSPQPQLMAARTPAMTEARRGACLSTGQCPMCGSRTCATLSSSRQSWRLVLPRPSCTCPPTPCPAHRGQGAETLCARSVPQKARSLPTAQGSAGSTET